MTLRVRNPLPPGSYAYCEPSCGWRDDSPAAEANGLLHSQALQHIVHVYVPDCDEPHVTDTGLVLSCGLEKGHGGLWHERDGWKWANP